LSLTNQTGRLLRGVVRISCARPRITVLIALLLAGLSMLYAARNLGFKTNQADLLPRNAYLDRYEEYEKQFGDLDDLVIVVDARSLPEAQAYAARLVNELRTRAVPLKRLTYRIDPRQFEGRALLYLSRKQLREIRDKIFDYQEFMESFAARPTLDQLIDGIATQIANAFVGSFLDLGLRDQNAEPSLDLKFIDDLVNQISARLDRPLPYRSPFGALFSAGDIDENAGYFLSGDRSLLFILARPQTEKGSFIGNARAIAEIRAVIADLRADFPRVSVGVTGKPALASDEMVAAFHDSEVAGAIGFALTLVLLLVVFLRVFKPIIMQVVLAISMAWAIGAATLIVGHLSLFSVMFVSIVIGIGIDYGIYFLFRYEEELFLGRGVQDAIETAARRVGSGMLVGAITASLTFFVLMLTEFRGLQELGIVSGMAILLAWVAMITVFPAALLIVDRRRGATAARTMPRAMALEHTRVPLVEHIAGHPKIVLGVSVILTILAIWGATKVRFDYNLLNLQSKRTESVLWERRIIETAGRSGFAALASAPTLDELRRKQEAFSKLPSVSEVDSALLLIPDEQGEKRKIIEEFAPLVAPVRIGRSLPVEVSRLISALDTLHRRLGIAANEAPEGGDAKQKLTASADNVQRLILRLRQTSPEQTRPQLSLLQYQVYRDFVGNFQRLQANLHPPTVGLEALPAELRQKFVGQNGHFLLRINPAVDIWELEGARKFVTELRAVDPEVTGTPVITYETILLMERSYRQATIYALILVAAVSYFLIRRVRLTLFALVPLSLGLLWTIGLMPLFRLKFNMGNIFALPLLIGMAIEFGLNVVLAYMEDREHGGPIVPRATVMAVLVNGLTTVIGFGSMLVAGHRGIYSLGLFLTIGMTAALIAALVVLPVLLKLLPPAAATAPPAPPRVPTPEAAVTR
jgi:hopanoid biosynthesis associated RND transporter like protein HpnN